ncbi:MAG TPA: Re/Si-specific NAD(P)(+) transhydrogenase subunit alpha [Bacteroidota bacterium]|nr:Re/Si-specific NAD(P)(+) transhydrogenase subunit alpha [Bacteroidota bacterium]
MNIGVPKEIAPGETRVALTPATVKQIVRDGHQVQVQSGAGAGASISDDDYGQAGGRIVRGAEQLYGGADVIIKVQAPRQQDGVDEAGLIRKEGVYIGFLSPFGGKETVKRFLERKITAYAMEYIPRITRAQSMDALSSMATLAGYKSVLMAADRMHKIFPMMMTAAGTISPATVLVLGAGVAGLQAIATAKRLGARVEAFDPRPAVKEQVKSLGATFIEMEVPEDAETSGGYARELSPEFIKKEMEAIGARLPKADVVITTAQVFGKRAPILITEAMVKMLRPDSVIIDLAADQGGNCELTVAGKEVEKHGVTIVGAVNVPAMIPIDSSQMYAKNVLNLFQYLYKKGSEGPDFTDDIPKGCCITRNGEIINESFRKAYSAALR